MLVFLNLARNLLKTDVALGDWAASRCCSGCDSGGELIGRASCNCGVVWSERSTSRGPVEDTGDGGSSSVSTRAGQ